MVRPEFSGMAGDKMDTSETAWPLTSERAEGTNVVSLSEWESVLTPDQIRRFADVVGIIQEALQRERCRTDQAEAMKERLERRLTAAEDRLNEAEKQLEYERGRVDQADRAAAQLAQLWDQARQEIAKIDHARREAEAALCAARACEESLQVEIEALKGGNRISRALHRMRTVGGLGTSAEVHDTRRGAQAG